MNPTEVLNTGNKKGKSVLGIVIALVVLNWAGFDVPSLLTDQSSPAPSIEDRLADMEKRIQDLEFELQEYPEKANSNDGN